MNSDKLKAVLDAHVKWLRGDADGKIAILNNADLIGAYLSGADLSGANLNNAYLIGAYLSGADLSGADLSGANLIGASLRGAKLNDLTIVSLDRRATRQDGYEFFLWQTNRGWRVAAGCRLFTLDEAWQHWETTRGDTPLGDETLDILTMFQLHVDRVGGGDE